MLSAIDAAAKILAETGEPMNTRQMIEVMATKGAVDQPQRQDAACHALLSNTQSDQHKGEGLPVHQERAREVHRQSRRVKPHR